MGKYLDIARKFEARLAEKNLSGQESSAPSMSHPSPVSSSFPCPACGGQIHLDPPDEHLPTRFWTCTGCGAWGVTRDGAVHPVVWVGSRAVQ